jgi:hypothetical protein
MRIRVSLPAVLGLCILAGGCGSGGSNGGGNGGPPVTLESGLHEMRAEVPNVFTSNEFVLVGSLMQSGSSVSGIMHFQGSSCFPFSTDISITGIASSSEIDVKAVLPNGQQVAFTGLTHPGGHLESLTGNYAVTGAGCLPTVQGLASDQAEALSGNWIGFLNSASGSTPRMSLNMTMTGPDAHGLFSATGNATITGGTCFSSANIDLSTVLILDGSTLVLDDAAPSSTGKTVLTFTTLFGPSNVGFGAGNGTYTSSEGACSDNGTFSLSQ